MFVLFCFAFLFFSLTFCFWYRKRNSPRKKIERERVGDGEQCMFLDTWWVSFFVHHHTARTDRLNKQNRNRKPPRITMVWCFTFWEMVHFAYLRICICLLKGSKRTKEKETSKKQKKANRVNNTVIMIAVGFKNKNSSQLIALVGEQTKKKKKTEIQQWWWRCVFVSI